MSRKMWEINPTLERGAITKGALAMFGGVVAVLLALAMVVQTHNASKFQRERDSLSVAVGNYEQAHRQLVQVDTLRAGRVRWLHTKADTVVQNIEHTTTDTVVLRLVDTLKVTYTAALAEDSSRIAFWHAASDSVTAQRNEAQRLLKLAPTPPNWALAATIDQGLRINLCLQKPLARVFGVSLNAGVCYRT